MGYDRQKSPFGTQISLSCYCFFLLINVFLDFNAHHHQLEVVGRLEWHLILYLFLCVSIFILLLYGVWFARLVFLWLFLFLLLILVIRTLLSLVFFSLDVDERRLFFDLFGRQLSLSSFHNCLWLINVRQRWFQCFGLLVSLLFNLLAFGGTVHLCSSIEHRERSWPYRKRTLIS